VKKAVKFKWRTITIKLGRFHAEVTNTLVEEDVYCFSVNNFPIFNELVSTVTRKHRLVSLKQFANLSKIMGQFH